MNNEILRDRYRHKLANLHLVTISVISAVELAVYLVFLSKGTHVLSVHCRYLWLCVVLPILLNYSAHLTARLIMGSSRFHRDIKDASITLAAYVAAASLSILHREYWLTLCSYTFPIVLSGFFNNKRLLNITSILSMCALLLTTSLLCFEYTVNTTFVVNQVVAYGFVLISHLSSVLAINFSHSSFSVIHDQEQENDQLQQIVQLDQMTGLYNHQAFLTQLDTAISKSKAGRDVFCLAVLDLDNFKHINDTYGHDRGDQVLLTLSRVLKEHCDSSDKICRYGGEEFAVIFCGKPRSQTTAVLQDVLSAFSACRYDFTDRQITFSCGVLEYDNTSAADVFFNRVDQMLYHAKRNGKNQICSG